MLLTDTSYSSLSADDSVDSDNKKRILQILEDISFGKIKSHERKRINKLLTYIKNNSLDMRIIPISLSLYELEPNSDVMNFVCVTEFVIVYIQDKVYEQSLINLTLKQIQFFITLSISQDISQDYLEHFADFYQNSEGLNNNYLQTYEDLRNTFRENLGLVESFQSVASLFRNKFSALYHYFKHRKLTTKTLSVNEYFGIIEGEMPIIHEEDGFKNMEHEFKYKTEEKKFDRYFYFVFRWQNRRKVLSSCRPLDDTEHID